MKKAIFLGIAILALSGCNSDDVDPQASEKYCASVKLSDNQYKIDKIKSDYHRENIELDGDYCENYDKYVFSKVESADGEANFTYDAPFLVSEFDDTFYTIGMGKEYGANDEILSLIISSDLNLDNLDARIKLLVNTPILPGIFGKYSYFDKSLAQIIEHTEDIDWVNVDFDDFNWIDFIINNLRDIIALQDEKFDTIDDAIAFDPHFSTSINAEELSDIYNNTLNF
ncbi:hypothetical protein LRP52_30285 [Photobacterium sp. ZSDE20]|uniref:Lipoprotein n=1 Tax=Photobacterium pectinilyticum TaxID=2906793 RepID=A0ABT1N557_9GAMM|nr:hypothetical protein [Photobacterium sp. ZSDE20]MCQ1059880.1 hypothetical protein [Photobacterium sp. ZSDE20]MDD1826471.1 hypothetical protein [Photobacterium sp. ZSDE20]